jgi:hypothetical protein
MTSIEEVLKMTMIPALFIAQCFSNSELWFAKIWIREDIPQSQICELGIVRSGY